MRVFFMALALMFVIEGFLPFLVPRVWRQLMQTVLTQQDKTLRVFGLVSMLMGLGILYLLH
ncbi:MAG: DUF2065 domain-containing protein [Gammaproteobacteria bacterium]